MLALTRSKGQSILIGDTDVWLGEHVIRITIIETGGRVKIGIEAPSDLVIARAELVKEKQKCVSQQ